MAALRSETDFTDPGLSRDRRRLALFLLVHLADEHGRMTGAYQRVLKRAAGDPGHWAHDRSPGAVRAEVARWIGAGARQDCRPPWDRIADLVEVAVEPGSAPEVLAVARHLHFLATGEPVPEGEPLKCPDWAAADHVTTTLIGGPEWARRHRLTEGAGPRVRSRAAKPKAPAVLLQAGQAPRVPVLDLQEPETGNPVTRLPEPRAAEPRAAEPRAAEPRAAEPRAAEPQAAEPRAAESQAAAVQVIAAEAVPGIAALTHPRQEQSAYELLWSVVRVHREMEERHLAHITALEEEVLALRAENARLTGDVTSWLGSYRPDIPAQRRRAVASRHLALEDPSQAFTYPLPAELPNPRA
ncbi:hypothetical protein [Saccharothrix lopnurensis]|uniref:Uncharacterized protein n=1 Tax=Saccharothrix lopnurensis TaxID=1670621 RepID=A0ABW1PH38_9PSEU